MSICGLFYPNFFSGQQNVTVFYVYLLSLLGMLVAKCQVVLPGLVLLLVLVSSLIQIPLGTAMHGSMGL